MPFCIALGGLVGGWWPLNIMFMLLVAAGVVRLAEQGGSSRLTWATALFLLGGAFVEYWWFGLAFTVSAWRYLKTGSKVSAAACALALAALYVVNNNLWALAFIPLMLAAPLVDVKLPRLQHVFYAFYPVHLAI